MCKAAYSPDSYKYTKSFLQWFHWRKKETSITADLIGILGLMAHTLSVYADSAMIKTIYSLYNCIWDSSSNHKTDYIYLL